MAGARRGFRRAPLFSRQPAYKPGSGRHANAFACVTAIPLGRQLPGASSNLPGRPDPDTIPKRVLAHRFAPSLFGLAPGGVYRAADVAADAVRSYRTISPLPQRTQTAAAVCFLWHCPWVRTRRMLSGTVCPRSPDFPLRQPFGFAGAAVRPTDSTRDGDIELARQVAGADNHAATLRITVQRAASRSGREQRWSGCGRGWQAVPVRC
jgi:hypothetical protein